VPSGHVPTVRDRGSLAVHHGSVHDEPTIHDSGHDAQKVHHVRGRDRDVPRGHVPKVRDRGRLAGHDSIHGSVDCGPTVHDSTGYRHGIRVVRCGIRAFRGCIRAFRGCGLSSHGPNDHDGSIRCASGFYFDGANVRGRCFSLAMRNVERRVPGCDRISWRRALGGDQISWRRALGGDRISWLRAS
jgi:hypothetical protein